MKRLLIAICLVLGFGASVPAQELSSPKPPSKVEQNLYRASQTSLVGGLVWDMVTTASALNRPMHMSYTDCPAGACRQVEQSVDFREVNWTSRMVGAKSAPAVIGVNLAIGAATLALSEVMHRKGGRWAKVATLLNASNGVLHLHAAAHNRTAMRTSERDLVPPPGATDVVRW